jgi:capsid protein
MVPYDPSDPTASAGQMLPFNSVPIERRMMVTIPAGWKMSQFKAEQPNQQYSPYVHEKVGELCRCLLIPKSLALGDSADLNYSSGRLDHQVYHRCIDIIRTEIEVLILDRLFAAWLDEMSMATDLIRGPERLEGYPHVWYWDGFGHVDPQKEALAQETRLKNHTTTLARESAKEGRDWKAQLVQRARELKLMTELDLPIWWAPQAVDPAAEETEETKPDEEADDDDAPEVEPEEADDEDSDFEENGNPPSGAVKK